MLAELINNTHTTFFCFAFVLLFFLYRACKESFALTSTCCSCVLSPGGGVRNLEKSSLWSAFMFVLLLVL